MTDSQAYNSGSSNALAEQALSIALRTISRDVQHLEDFCAEVRIDANAAQSTAPGPATVCLTAGALAALVLLPRKH